jgi:hypothetical protein
MRRLLIVAMTTAVLGGTPAVAGATSEPVAQVACKQARIAGQSKCIARGQFCARSAQAMRDYRKYGLNCTKRDVNGRYHLQ